MLILEFVQRVFRELVLYDIALCGLLLAIMDNVGIYGFQVAQSVYSIRGLYGLQNNKMFYSPCATTKSHVSFIYQGNM